MATLIELYNLRNDSALRARITSAVAIAAEAIRIEDVATANHANRLIWAKDAWTDPEAMATRMLWAILSANESATVAQITGASEAAVKSNVANAVNVFADGTSVGAP